MDMNIIRLFVKNFSSEYKIGCAVIGGSFGRKLKKGSPLDSRSDLDLIMITATPNIRVHGNRIQNDVKIDYFIYSVNVLMAEILADSFGRSRALCNLINDAYVLYDEGNLFGRINDTAKCGLFRDNIEKIDKSVLVYSRVKNMLDDYCDRCDKGESCNIIGIELVYEVIKSTFILSGKTVPHRKGIEDKLRNFKPLLYSVILETIHSGFVRQNIENLCDLFFEEFRMKDISSWHVEWNINSGISKLKSIKINGIETVTVTPKC